jgi:hypothetical protein
VRPTANESDSAKMTDARMAAPARAQAIGAAKGEEGIAMSRQASTVEPRARALPCAALTADAEDWTLHFCERYERGSEGDTCVTARSCAAGQPPFLCVQAGAYRDSPLSSSLPPAWMRSSLLLAM